MQKAVLAKKGFERAVGRVWAKKSHRTMASWDLDALTILIYSPEHPLSRTLLF